ncbi:MAG: hypothetical protein K2N13_05880 [Paraprevotella sp.]|nr:hypothetical protein [Paraprevotella sp.]
MTSYKQLICSLLLFTTSGLSYAQTNGSNSSYSRFGLGTLNEQSQGFNRSMSGLSQGIRKGNVINMQNPASYAAIDSLSFIFDVGMALQGGRFKQGATTMNVYNTSLEYINAGFRINKGLGLSFGFMPYTTIGYNFTRYSTNDETTATFVHTGNGGLHEAYIGIGWSPFRNFSIGANAGYLWGEYNHSIVQTLSNGGNGLNRLYEADLYSYKLDIGAQYRIALDKRNTLTVGATVGIGHVINSTAYNHSFTSNSDTITQSATKAFELPYTISVGAAWNHKDRWTVGADVLHERWSKCKSPYIPETAGNNSSAFVSKEGAYLNRTKAIIGAEYVPDPTNRKYGQRIRYRMGASFSTPYVKINGADGPREYGITAGIGLPISNKINSRSLINVGVQWSRIAPSNSLMITEDYFKINIGLTFNERWFMKWKIN